MCTFHLHVNQIDNCPDIIMCGFVKALRTEINIQLHIIIISTGIRKLQNYLGI